MDEQTHLIRHPGGSEAEAEFALEETRDTDTLGEYEQMFLSLVSARGAVWNGQVDFTLDGEIAAWVAVAIAHYAHQRGREARSKRKGMSLDENYMCCRLEFLARQILDALRA